MHFEHYNEDGNVDFQNVDPQNLWKFVDKIGIGEKSYAFVLFGNVLVTKFSHMSTQSLN